MMLDEELMFSFLLVFVRCSAMLMSSPLFGAQTTPLPIRIMTIMSISAALTLALQPGAAGVPTEMYGLAAAVANEVLAGLLIGFVITLGIQAAQIGGAYLDLQIGLGMSQTLNPATGVPVTLLSQYKYMLAVVVFLGMNGHHLMLHAFAASYESMPPIGMAMLPVLHANLIELIGQISLIALRIAAPVAAVGLVVDAALGIVNKAVPQMHALMVGLPAKLLVGIIALSIALPTMAGAVQAGVEVATETLWNIMSGAQ
jgi:flagellar biosynthesis protein FliR